MVKRLPGAGAVMALLSALRPQSTAPEAEGEISWIEPADLALRLEREPRPLIIDVRGPDEFMGTLGHLEGARNIPLAELPQRLGALDGFKDAPVVLVCQTQIRSAKAATLMGKAGFRDVAVLRGGMAEWSRRKA
jgi:rhodanese-related sulfurtransferase